MFVEETAALARPAAVLLARYRLVDAYASARGLL
jgi:hypothetical protein